MAERRSIDGVVLAPNQHKVFVKVRADHELDGMIRPLLFRSEEGETVRIDRILDIRRAAATKAGGQGIRYTCRIGSNQVYLFHDRDIWFIEV